MKKRLLITFLLLCFIHAAFSLERSSNPIELFNNGNGAYTTKNYKEAIKFYEQLIASGKHSEEVYFNLGNSYFKDNHISKAILNYERARIIDPADEDILFNLRIAYNNTVDKIDPVPLLFYQRWWLSFIHFFSPAQWNVISIISIWLTFFCGIAYLFAGTINRKRNTFLSTLVLLGISFLFYFLAYSSSKSIYGNNEAIIMNSSSYIRSSPDEKSTKLFMLHEGTKVKIIDEIDEWKQIRIANGNVGWVDNKSIEKI